MNQVAVQFIFRVWLHCSHASIDVCRINDVCPRKEIIINIILCLIKKSYIFMIHIYIIGEWDIIGDWEQNSAIGCARKYIVLSSSMEGSGLKATNVGFPSSRVTPAWTRSESEPRAGTARRGGGGALSQGAKLKKKGRAHTCERMMAAFPRAACKEALPVEPRGGGLEHNKGGVGEGGQRHEREMTTRVSPEHKGPF